MSLAVRVLVSMIFENFLFNFFLIKNFSYVLCNTHMAACTESFHGCTDK